MKIFRLNPPTEKQWQRFRSIKRGYYSLLGVTVLLAMSLVAELLVNNRAIAVRYDGNLYFPTYSAFIPGTEFGLGYEYETNYRELKTHFESQPANWVLLSPVPYSAFETNFQLDSFPPYSPSFEDKHFLGTEV